MTLVAILAVEIFLEHEPAVPRDHHAMNLQRIRRIHRHVDDHLDESLHRRAIDVLRLERRGGPAIVAAQRRTIDIAARILAARIELACVVGAREIVAATAAGEDKRDHLIVGVVCPDADLLLLAPALAHQLHAVAVAYEPINSLLRSEIELRIAQHGAERSIGPRVSQQKIEREGIGKRNHFAAPTIGTVELEQHGCEGVRRGGTAAIHRRAELKPVPEDVESLELAAKSTEAVRQFKAQLTRFHANWHPAPEQVGAVGAAFLLNDQWPAGIRPEATLGFPKAGDIRAMRTNCCDANKNPEPDRTQIQHGGLP